MGSFIQRSGLHIVHDTPPKVFSYHGSARSPCLRLGSRRQVLCEARSTSGGDVGKLALLSFASGALLGPICDGFHSSHDVLHYANPSFLNLSWIGYTLETCWWVPVLFGIAGMILGVSHPLLDEWRKSQPGSQFVLPGGGFSPNWPFVFTCIALFLVQYYASGTLGPILPVQNIEGIHSLDIILLLFALHHFVIFDRTLQGFYMACLTAVCGPLIEITLINGFHLYAYSHPDILGVPSWIPWVYFCGAPSVGNLGRKFWHELKGPESKL